MIWMIFIEILKNKIQMKNAKFRLFLITLFLICLVKKKINPILTELLIRGRKLNISLIFIMYLIFLFQKHIRLNSKHYLIIEI